MSSVHLSEQRTWALTLGTVFFAVVAYWLVQASAVPASEETSSLGLVLKSILSAEAAWFLLLGWILTSSVYLGFARWPAYFARYRQQWSAAARTVAWRRFRSALWKSLVISLLWLTMVRLLSLVKLEKPGFDPVFLLRELHLVTDPLSSFVLLFVLLDLIRTDLYAHALRSRHAMIAVFLVSLGVETWVWAEYLGLGFQIPLFLPLILAVLWGALQTYQTLLAGRGGAFWVRLGWALGIFVVFDIGLSLLDSPWSSGWSFYVAEVSDPVALLAIAAMAFAIANAAVLHRISRALTRTE